MRAIRGPNEFYLDASDVKNVLVPKAHVRGWVTLENVLAETIGEKAVPLPEDMTLAEFDRLVDASFHFDAHAVCCLPHAEFFRLTELASYLEITRLLALFVPYLAHRLLTVNDTDCYRRFKSLLEDEAIYFLHKSHVKALLTEMERLRSECGINFKQSTMDEIRHHILWSGSDPWNLRCAARANNVKLVNMLLPHVFQQDPDMVRAAYREAASARHTDVCKAMIPFDFLANKYDYYLVEACTYGDRELVSYLLPLAEYTVRILEKAFRRAVDKKHTEVTRLLLANPRVDPSAKDNKAIRLASAKNNVDILKLLLTDGRVDPAVYSNLVIRNACIWGTREMVALLLADPRVNPVAQNGRPFFNAVEHRSWDNVSQMITDARIDPTAMDSHCLKEVMRAGNIALLQQLFSHPVHGAVLQHDALHIIGKMRFTAMHAFVLANTPAIGGFTVALSQGDLNNLHDLGSYVAAFARDGRADFEDSNAILRNAIVLEECELVKTLLSNAKVKAALTPYVRQRMLDKMPDIAAEVLPPLRTRGTFAKKAKIESK
jgi:hypothetical protein